MKKFLLLLLIPLLTHQAMVTAMAPETDILTEQLFNQVLDHLEFKEFEAARNCVLSSPVPQEETKATFIDMIDEAERQSSNSNSTHSTTEHYWIENNEESILPQTPSNEPTDINAILNKAQQEAELHLLTNDLPAAQEIINQLDNLEQQAKSYGHKDLITKTKQDIEYAVASVKDQQIKEVSQEIQEFIEKKKSDALSNLTYVDDFEWHQQMISDQHDVLSADQINTLTDQLNNAREEILQHNATEYAEVLKTITDNINKYLNNNNIQSAMPLMKRILSLTPEDHYLHMRMQRLFNHYNKQ